MNVEYLPLTFFQVGTKANESSASGHKSTGRKFSLDSKHPEHKGFFAGLMSLMGRKLSAGGSARDVTGGGSEDCAQRCFLKKLVQIQIGETLLVHTPGTISMERTFFVVEQQKSIH
jgi:hypothetical protein